MKKVLNWVKGHALIVVFAAVAVIALPAMLFFSSRMNASLQEEVSGDASGIQRDLQQISVTYALEPLDPSAPAVSFQAVPNEPTTEAMRRVIERNKETAEQMLDAAVAHNSAGKTPMLEGLLPEPAPDEVTAKRQAANAAWIRAHEELLAEVNAGGPPSVERLQRDLQSVEIEQRERRLSSMGVSELSPEQEQELRQELVDRRLGILESRAAELYVYATMDVFENVEPIPSTELPTMERIWDWQHRLWIHQDLVRAVAGANRDDAGRERPIPSAAVKRIERISVTPRTYEGVSTEPVTAGLEREIDRDLGVSLTGRTSWPSNPNPLYDARYAEMDVIADSAQLERLLNAIAEANFMTVLDMDLEQVDPRAALAEGYFYGARSDVVRAKLLIETLWLRRWTAPLMPPGVKNALGVPAASEGEPEQGETPADAGRARGR